jgi:predicted DNA-binding transcriptional regulator AlpA
MPVQIISAEETAARLTISETTLWRLRRADPDFPVAVRVGARRIGFREDDLDRWIRAGGAK